MENSRRDSKISRWKIRDETISRRENLEGKKISRFPINKAFQVFKLFAMVTTLKQVVEDCSPLLRASIEMFTILLDKTILLK